MLTIIVDTNFWLIPYQFHIDIIQAFKEDIGQPYELAIIDKTQYELQMLIDKGTPEERAAARIGFELLRRSNVIHIKTDKLLNVDQHIENTVHGPNFAVATQDKELKEKIRAKGGRLVVMRQKKRIELI